jgi:hypothetical protein
VGEEKKMNAQLMEVPQPEVVSEQFGSLMNYLNRLEEFQETVISLLPFASDVEVDEVRLRGMAMGATGWRIVCACDAVAISRAIALKGGRGKVDTAGEGKLSAAKERGRLGGYDAKQAWRNAQIFNTFKTTLIDQTSLLDDKGYFEQALRTPQPRKTIKKFEKEKQNNPNFTVSDAAKLAKLIRENRKQVTIPDDPDYINPNLKAFLLELDASLASFYTRCPREEFKPRIAAWRRATRFELARTPQKDYEAVRSEVDKLASTVEEIAEEVYLSHSEIKTICDLIIEKEPETYEWRPIGVDTDVRRGALARGIFRKDSPHYEGRGYAPTIDWE